MDETLTANINGMAPFGELLGIEWLEAGPDEVTARLAWDEAAAPPAASSTAAR